MKLQIIKIWCLHLPNRSCSDNILLVQEALFRMKKKVGKLAYVQSSLTLKRPLINWNGVLLEKPFTISNSLLLSSI